MESKCGAVRELREIRKLEGEKKAGRRVKDGGGGA